jgi:dihydrofolate synthase/folylpolyglutamate synthase
MDAAGTLAWLTGLRSGGSRLGVERMAELARRLGLGDWLRATPTFHVAGTNGKGSTCAMIDAIQRAHGRRTGLFTSPHLVSLGERVRVDGAPLGRARLLDRAEELRRVHAAILAESPDLAPTFFELMTALAFLEFRDARCEVVVLETGLGGRLDASNVCHPLVTAITSIGLDHQEYLGDTLAAIAREKAGILKPGAPLALGDLPAEAAAAVRARAAELGVDVRRARDRFPGGLPATNLEGAHQRVNAGVALLACELAGEALPLDEALARRALLAVDWPARWQRIPSPDGRLLIVDASHNEEGARALEPLLAGLDRPTVIVGATGDTRAAPLLAAVARHAGRLLLVEPATERATPATRLAELLPPVAPPQEAARVADLFPAPGICAAPGKVVVVVGSLYLAGEVLARLRGEAHDGDLQDRLLPPRS